ncbi:MAG: SRPBCC domain-containing protein [Sphingobacteriales bacterium]|nr:MAG: SRPBCC domain-containing protein [Sphingobacteriales bacterium]
MSYPPFQKTILINASPAAVWQALTYPELMQQWMSETPFEILTTWEVGSSFSITGPWYKSKFENQGKVLQFQPERVLSYSHLSSLSRLPFTDANFCILSFRLEPQGNGTQLNFTAENFPTEAIYRHLVFYWNVALELLRKFVEQQVL